MGLTSVCFKQKFLFQEGRCIGWWIAWQTYLTYLANAMGRSQPKTERDIVWVFERVCMCISIVFLGFFSAAIPLPFEASSPSSFLLRPWGSLQSAAPYLTETQPPFKYHPPIYLMCSSTRTPSIHPQGARISKHSNSLGVAISTGLELYSQIPKSLRSIVP